MITIKTILTTFFVGMSIAQIHEIPVLGLGGKRCSLQLEAEEITSAELYREVATKLGIPNQNLMSLTIGIQTLDPKSIEPLKVEEIPALTLAQFVADCSLRHTKTDPLYNSMTRPLSDHSILELPEIRFFLRPDGGSHTEISIEEGEAVLKKALPSLYGTVLFKVQIKPNQENRLPPRLQLGLEIGYFFSLELFWRLRGFVRMISLMKHDESNLLGIAKRIRREWTICSTEEDYRNGKNLKLWVAKKCDESMADNFEIDPADDKIFGS